MKKNRNILAVLVLVCIMLLPACGKNDAVAETSDTIVETSNPFVGEWKGSMDITETIEESVLLSLEEDMAEYINFEGLEIALDFRFEEGWMGYNGNKASVEEFNKEMEEQLTENMSEWLEGVAVKNGLTTDEILTEKGMSLEDLIANSIDTSYVDTFAAANEEGIYEYDEKTKELLITYDSGDEEIFKYEFQGDVLILTSYDGEMVFRCEKAVKP